MGCQRVAANARHFLCRVFQEVDAWSGAQCQARLAAVEHQTVLGAQSSGAGGPATMLRCRLERRNRLCPEDSRAPVSRRIVPHHGRGTSSRLATPNTKSRLT